LSLRIFYDNTNLRLKNWKRTSEVISKIIGKENSIIGNINVVITKDKEVREINIRFLEHDYNTDVISFSYNEGNIINGEIYISIDTVKTNSFNYNVSLNEELNRVIIHGVLHLVGYDDKEEDQKDNMTRLENIWLELLYS
jgi:probable rRNA maturation factor